jgi:hypothetical protein
MQKFISKYLFFIAMIFLLWAAFAGLMLRYVQTFGLSEFKIDRWLQMHSHVAFLGWGFLGLIFLLSKKISYPLTKIDYILNCILICTVVGMMVAFPLFGYTIISILFLILFLLASYILLFRYLIFVKSISEPWKKWVISGIYFYYISSMAVWLIPLVILKTGKGDLYFNLVYFYLHFLYNGFFTFVIWGLIFKYLKEKFQVRENLKQRLFYNLLLLSAVPTYVLSLYWNPPHPTVEITGIFFGIIQLLGLVLLIADWWERKYRSNRNWLFNVILFVFIVKIFLQFLSSFYSISKGAIALKPYFVVGYIHWFTLGFLSLSLMWLADFIKDSISRIGFFLFISGFITTEFILFYNGTIFLLKLDLFVFAFSDLFYGSLLMFLGIFIMVIKYFNFLKNISGRDR